MPGFRRENMARYRTHSIEFKHRVAQEYLSGETLHGLAKRHGITRNLIRVWVRKYEEGAFSTRRHQYGFRLGNVGVLTPWGITKELTLDRLRLGSRTLEQHYVGLKPLGFFAPDNSQRLTYF